jgi:hypothetical protein
MGGFQAIGEKLTEIGNRTQQPPLTEELAQQIEVLWKDPAIQATYLRANELQLPDCASHFLNDIHRLAQPDYVPSQVKMFSSLLSCTAQHTAVVHSPILAAM